MKVWPHVPTSRTLTFPTFAPEMERWGMALPSCHYSDCPPPLLSFPQLPPFLHPSLSPISSSLCNVSSAFLTSSTFFQCSGACFTHSLCCVKEGLSLADSPTTLSIYLRDLFLLLTFLWSRMMEYTTKTIMSCSLADRGWAGGWTFVDVSCKKLLSGGQEMQVHGLTLTVLCVYISKHNSRLYVLQEVIKTHLPQLYSFLSFWTQIEFEMFLFLFRKWAQSNILL